MAAELATGVVMVNDATILTLSGGVVTQTQEFHAIAAEAGAADDLDTVTPMSFAAAGITYHPKLILMADTGDTITVKHGTGNIDLTGAADIDISGDDLLFLFYNGTNWSDNKKAAGAGESNTASNAGSGGIGIFDGKVGIDLEMRNIISDDGTLDITLDAGNKEVNLEVAVLPASVLVDTGSVDADAASITATGWDDPGFTIRRLVLVLKGLESDRAANPNDHILVTLNTDGVAANYNSNVRQLLGNAATSAEVVGTVSGIRVRNGATAATSDAGCFGVVEITIYDPENTTDKTAVKAKTYIMGETANESGFAFGGGHWETTDAITTITVAPENGTTFLVGGAGEPVNLEWQLIAYR